MQPRGHVSKHAIKVVRPASNDPFEVASVCWRYKKKMMIFLLFQFFVSTAALLEAAEDWAATAEHRASGLHAPSLIRCKECARLTFEQCNQTKIIPHWQTAVAVPISQGKFRDLEQLSERVLLTYQRKWLLLLACV